MNQTFIIASTALMISSLSMKAQTWIDVTDQYITNPRFEGNDLRTGWQGTAFGSANPRENAEHYSRNYNSYQELTDLTPGLYRLRLSAFYRSGGASDDWEHYNSDDPSEYQNAFLYATASDDFSETPIALASSAALEQSLGGGTSGVDAIQGGGGGGGGWPWGGWGTQYRYQIPNNMEAAYYWFEAGYYHNELEVRVGDDGHLYIGIYKETLLSGDWTCLDNWKLEYFGELVLITKIEFEKKKYEINRDETLKLNITYAPDNATYKKVVWVSSDESVVTVDDQGNITGQSQGTATITAYANDGSGVEAQCQVTVVSNGGNSESMIINEIMAANVDMFVDPSWNYGGWVELYNPTDRSANIGKYWVSDDPQNLKKAMLPMRIGSIPAHGFFTLWFDHADTRKDIGENWLNTQVNMKLSTSGGTIYISDDAGNLIVSQDYPPAVMRASWARTTDGGDTWGLTAFPTPSATNTTSMFASEQLPLPEVDKAGQMFEGTMQVVVSIPEGTTLKYTTDGSTPTADNGEVSSTGLFSIDYSTVFRFRLFRDGYLPSGVVTRSYIYRDRNYYLPVVSVVTDPVNLYDNTIGVYVSGNNGKTANQDYTKRNFNMDWDRPVNFEYLVDNEEVVNQEVNFSIAGGWSRKYEPRSFKLKANSVYGENKYEYPFFSDKPYNRNKSVLMRNGGNDEYNQFRIKDAALQEIARQSGFKLDLQSYQPTHVFINGTYLAMLNMREPSNKHYGYANYGIDTDEIDCFEMSVDSGYVQKNGTREAFDHWYDLTVSLADDPQNADLFSQICDVVDIDNYTNYMAFKFFLNDWDWPHNNCKAFRDRNDGKFHFVVFDLDNCVDRTGNNIFNDFQSKQMHTFYGRPEYGGSSLRKEVELVTIFLNMIKNDEFRKKFIDTYCLVGGCVFRDDEENTRIINELAENVRTALLWEGHDPVTTGTSRARTGGIISAITGNFKQTMMTVMKNYSTFELQNTALQALQIGANIEGAHLLYNGMEIPKGMFNGYGFAPITLTAQPQAGYKFKGWKEAETVKRVSKEIFSMGSTWSYYDKGSLDSTGWSERNYIRTGWSSAQAPFGHGNAGKPMANATTVLDIADKKPTYYFRRNFTLDNAPADNEQYTFTYQVDDGMIAYVNGVEIGRYIMPSGAKYSDYVQTFENVWVGDDPYEATITIDKSLLRKGTNVICVEVHDCNATSSDIWFDGSIAVSVDEGMSDKDLITTEYTYTVPTSGAHNIVAIYEPMTSDEILAEHLVPVRINEVSAANSIYVNDYYKKNDWIELYNTTDEAIDLAGMFVSDNENKPQKYQIPESDDVNTIIPAHGYMVVWCDKLDPLSQVHTSFKLDADGGSVLISAADLAWADTLQYPAHDGTISVGRYPDGNDDVLVMHRPTIGESNINSSYDTLYVKPEGDDMTGIGSLIAHNGTMRIIYDGGYIVVRSEDATMATLNIYTATGVNTQSASLNLMNGYTTTYVGSLPQGVYIARVKNADGESCACKFVVR